jgi:hypothetical protein
VANGVAVVHSYPSLSCYSHEYLSVQPIFVILLVVVVIGGPLAQLIGLTIAYARKNLDKQHQAKWGTLYENYQPNRFFWWVISRWNVFDGLFVMFIATCREFAVLARRVILVGVTVLNSANRLNMETWLTFTATLFAFVVKDWNAELIVSSLHVFCRTLWCWQRT